MKYIIKFNKNIIKKLLLNEKSYFMYYVQLNEIIIFIKLILVYEYIK